MLADRCIGPYGNWAILPQSGGMLDQMDFIITAVEDSWHLRQMYTTPKRDWNNQQLTLHKQIFDE